MDTRPGSRWSSKHFNRGGLLLIRTDHRLTEIKPYWPRKTLWIDWSESLQRNFDFEANYPIFQKLKGNGKIMYGICSAEVDAAPQGSQWPRCFSAIFAQIWVIFRDRSEWRFFCGHCVHHGLARLILRVTPTLSSPVKTRRCRS